LGVVANEVSEPLLLEELEIYRQEVAQSAQFLYAYLSIHALGADQDIRRGLNAAALFWNTILGALQTSIFITLGRVFDANNQHGPVALVRTLRRAQTAFSRASLKARKEKIFGNDSAGLEEYLADIFVPGEKEFGRLDRLADGYTQQFNSTVYRELRSKVFAHKVYTDNEKVADLFSETNIDDLQRMANFLYRLHDAVRNAYDNGARLRLRRGRRSVNEMLQTPRGRRAVKPVAEEMTEVTRRVLQTMADGTPAPR
jgi:hypothetical protein